MNLKLFSFILKSGGLKGLCAKHAIIYCPEKLTCNVWSVRRKTRDMPYSLGVYTLRGGAPWLVTRTCLWPPCGKPALAEVCVSHLASKAQADELTIRRFTWVSAVSEPWPVRDAKEEDGYRSVHPMTQRLHAPHPRIAMNTARCMGFFECGLCSQQHNVSMPKCWSCLRESRLD